MNEHMESGLALPEIEKLRDGFDRGFAEPPQRRSSAMEEFLLVSAGGTPLAFRLTDVGALHSGKTVVPVPIRVSELLGVAAFRNAVLPIYDLRALLGLEAKRSPRWIVATRSESAVGLAFDAFVRHIRIRPEEITRDADSTAGRYTRGAVAAGGMHPIVDVASLLSAIGQRARLSPTSKES